MKEARNVKPYFKRDATNKVIPPDYWSDHQPQYLNHNIVEYEVTMNGEYYGTVHVPSAKKKNEMDGSVSADSMYWARISEMAKQRAHAIYPRLKKLEKEKRVSINFVQIII